MTAIFIRENLNIDTQGIRPFDNRGGDWSYVVISQGTPVARKGKEGFSPRPSEGAWPCQLLNFGLQAS